MEGRDIDRFLLLPDEIYYNVNSRFYFKSPEPKHAIRHEIQSYKGSIKNILFQRDNAEKK